MLSHIEVSLPLSCGEVWLDALWAVSRLFLQLFLCGNTNGLGLGPFGLGVPGLGGVYWADMNTSILIDVSLNQWENSDNDSSDWREDEYLSGAGRIVTHFLESGYIVDLAVCSE